MRYRAIIVVVLTVVAVAGVVVALSTGRTTPRRRGSTPPPATSTTLPTSTSTTTAPPPSTTSTGPRTAVATFDPWLGPGKLTPGYPVRSVKTGRCTTPPVTQDSGNPSAWRCTTVTGDAFLNVPCFAPRGADDVTEVACLPFPTRGTAATLVRLSPPLASGTRATARGFVLWTFYLSNGERCQDIWGTHTRFGTVELPYGCTGGHGGFTSTPDTAVEPWTVTFLTGADCTGERCAGPPETVAVTKVWR